MADLIVPTDLAAALTAERDRLKIAALAASKALVAAEQRASEHAKEVERAEADRQEAWTKLRRVNGALNSLGANPEGRHYPTLADNIVRLEIEWYPDPESQD